MHVHDVVTDWSYALVQFFVSMLFGVSPGHAILAIFHIANVLVRFPQYRSINLRIMRLTCISEDNGQYVIYSGQYVIYSIPVMV